MNTNIPLSARMFKQKPLMESYGDAMSLKNMANRGQMQEMQMQDYQQSRADDLRFKDLVRQANGDPQKLLAAQSEIDPIGGMQAQAEYAGTQADNESKQLELALKKNQALFQILTSSRDPQSYQAALQEAGRLLGPDVIAKAPKEYNPEFVKQMAIQSLDLDKQIKARLDESKATLDQSNSDREFNLNKEKFDFEKGKAVVQPEVKLTNFLMPDNTKVTVPSGDAAAINQAIQNGGIETGMATPIKTMSPKENQVARQKITSADILLQQLTEVENKFKKIQNTFSAGKGGSFLPTEAGEAFDKAVDNMRASVTGLQKVPGLGSMSDYETRLDQSKIPSRGNYESVTADQIQYIKDYANQIKQAYSDMLGDSQAQPNTQTSGQPVQITSDAEWERLAPGTTFIDPEGVTRVK